MYKKMSICNILCLYNYQLFQGEVSKKTISEIKEHLLTPLQKFSKIKDEKQLMADLWCHFGKALVSNVDEGNNT